MKPRSLVFLQGGGAGGCGGGFIDRLSFSLPAFFLGGAASFFCAFSFRGCFVSSLSGASLILVFRGFSVTPELLSELVAAGMSLSKFSATRDTINSLP